MARFTFSMNVSLDGYVDHDRFAPDAALFRHWIEAVRAVSGSIYGRRMYEVMRYWDEDHPEWDADLREFASVWRAQRKWVVSRTLDEVGPNATLIGDDVEGQIRAIRDTTEGEVAICGTKLAQSVTDMGLIDEYRMYYHPVVLGSGVPFFAGPRPPLRLTDHARIGGEAIRLTFVPV
ncbi:dihydrofolate reductase family protein [Oceaniglobus roseus]|uniref:dihydrofolate reductase family protein n=1 Tax=Oceaniglobus roseus TaxID=1737570 RepID=UPI000C7EAE15|nr:dihydrofolate reductase family protein [Kandeliimicrobium roseum]